MYTNVIKEMEIKYKNLNLVQILIKIDWCQKQSFLLIPIKTY